MVSASALGFALFCVVSRKQIQKKVKICAVGLCSSTGALGSEQGQGTRARDIIALLA
jgi:hypothetical protein